MVPTEGKYHSADYFTRTRDIRKPSGKAFIKNSVSVRSLQDASIFMVRTGKCQERIFLMFNEAFGRKDLKRHRVIMGLTCCLTNSSCDHDKDTAGGDG